MPPCTCRFMLQQKIDYCLLYVSQSNGHDRATVFVSLPPGVDWPQIAGSTAQTSASTEDVDWVVLGVREDARDDPNFDSASAA